MSPNHETAVPLNGTQPNPNDRKNVADTYPNAQRAASAMRCRSHSGLGVWGASADPFRRHRQVIAVLDDPVVQALAGLGVGGVIQPGGRLGSLGDQPLCSRSPRLDQQRCPPSSSPPPYFYSAHAAFCCRPAPTPAGKRVSWPCAVGRSRRHSGGG